MSIYSSAIGFFSIGFSPIGISVPVIGSLNDYKSIALASFTPGNLLLSTWYSPNALYFNNSGLFHETPVSGLSGVGFSASCADSAYGVYMATRDHTRITYLSSGLAVTQYAAPSGITFTGAVFASGYTYFVDSVGVLTSMVSGTPTALIAGYGAATPAQGLAAIGNTLYTIEAASSAVGTFTLATQLTGTSGTIAAPMTVPACLATSGQLAVGGWNYTSFASGYSAIALEPATDLLLVGVASGTGTMGVYTGAGSGIWTLTQTITGVGRATNVVWSGNDQFVFAANPTSGQVAVFTNSFGTLARTGTLTVTGATATAIMPGSATGLVAQGSLNEITGIAFTGATWITANTLPLTNAMCVVGLTSTTAIAGKASGFANLQLAAGLWTITSSGTLPFTPTKLAVDPYGIVYAVGTSGSSGVVANIAGTTMLSSGSWAGTGIDLFYQQGQIAVLDSVNSLVRMFGVVNNTLVAQAQTAITPSGATGFANDRGLDTFIAGASETRQYYFDGPYQLVRQRSGVVSIYTGSAWNSAILGPSGIPTALAWSGSGLSAVTLQNHMYTINTSGVVTAVTQINQAAPQLQSAPFGLSNMKWLGSNLFSTTILNDSIVQVQ